MFSNIMSFLHNSAVIGVFLVILGYIPSINKVIEAHLETKTATKRNAHELSLMRAADRIIPQVLLIARASKQDRINRAVDLLAQYAESRHIKISHAQLKGFIRNAINKYKANGGNVAETIKDTVTDL